MTRKSNQMSSKDERALQKAPNASKSVHESELESNFAAITRNVRISTLSVATVGMLFCALFWPAVLDFRAKIARDHRPVDVNAEKTQAPAEIARPIENEVEEDWRAQLDALYPRETFELEESDYEPPLALGDDDPVARAARFNGFSPEPVTYENDPFFTHAENDDEPLPEAPRTSRSARAAQIDLFDEPLAPPEHVDVFAYEEESDLLADLPPVDPDDPLGLDSAFPETSSSSDPFYETSETLSADEFEFDPLPVAPGLPPRIASTSYDSFAENDDADLAASPPVENQSVDYSAHAESPSIIDDSIAQTTMEVSPAIFDDAPDPIAAITGDLGFPIAAPDPVLDTDAELFVEDLPAAQEPLPSVSDAPNFDDSQSLAAEPVAVPETSSDASPEHDRRIDLKTYELEGLLAPSYFSRAVGLFGGQSAFSALYFARATRLVADRKSWSPGSWSRVANFDVADDAGVAQASGTSLEAAPASPPSTEVPEPTLDEEESADAIRSKYPTLVGYVERQTVQAPSPLESTPIDSDATSDDAQSY